MKRILIILIISGVFFSSCSDILNTTPSGSLSTQTAYTSPSLINNALVSIYLGLRNSNIYGQFYPWYENAPTDESFFFSSGSTYYYTYYLNRPNDGGQIQGFWQQCYSSINCANTMLANIDASAAIGKVDTVVVRKAKGEALFLRSYYYFLLTQWFGSVPLILEPIGDPSQILIAKSSEKVVYDQIIVDMTKSVDLLNGQTCASLGYNDKVTQDAAQAILARVCLYAAGQPVNGTVKYDKAACYHLAALWASKVILSGKHSLLSDYTKVFTDLAQNLYNSENIWEIGFNQFGVGTVSASGTTGIYCGIGHSYLRSSITDDYDGYCYNYCRPQPRLFLSYEPGDYRRDWNVANYTFKSSGFSTTAANFYNDAKVPLDTTKLWSRCAGKWRREYETSTSRYVKNSSAENFTVIRYADVLLMYAEALNEIDSTSVGGCTLDKFAAINLVRGRSIATSQVVDHISWVTGTGYLADPVITVSGGGGSGAVVSSASTYLMSTTSNRTINCLLTAQGSGYTSAPTITIGNIWTPNTAYTKGTQVVSGTRLYTVNTAGTSTTTAPTNTSGNSSAAITGAVFFYAGVAASAKAYLSPARTSPVLLVGLNTADFRAAINMERYHELCFEALRLQDLRRWGILIPTVLDMANDVTATNMNGFYIKNSDGSNSSYYESFKWPMHIPNTVELPTLGDVPYVNQSVNFPAQNIGAKDWYWPIPQREIGLNYLLTQNPGY
ncbi:MAG: RagB/SusD family nutrient uptake outer membrane protein [Paludibacter sp.]|nr:RagB/SusD family nutrient uptake outer membrane protein [Paludibacter sp.]